MCIRDSYTWCEPLTDDTAATVRLGTKERLSDGFAWTLPVPIGASGRAGLRGRGRFGRVRVSHSAGATSWTKDTGVEGIVKSPGGPR